MINNVNDTHVSSKKNEVEKIVKLYDEEDYAYYRLEACLAEDVAENGEHARFLRGEYQHLPSPEIIAQEVKKHGWTRLK